jgi:hypothetical protein
MAYNHGIAPFGQPHCGREPSPPQQKFPTWEVRDEREKRVEPLEYFS